MLPERHGSSLNRREFLVVGGVVVGGFGPVDGAALLDADFKVVWDLVPVGSYRSRIARWTMNRASDARDQRTGGARRRSCQFARCMSPFCR